MPNRSTPPLPVAKSQIMGPKECVMDLRTWYHSPTLFRTNPDIGPGTDVAEDNARNQPLDLSTARSGDQSWRAGAKTDNNLSTFYS